MRIAACMKAGNFTPRFCGAKSLGIPAEQPVYRNWTVKTRSAFEKYPDPNGNSVTRILATEVVMAKFPFQGGEKGQWRPAPLPPQFMCHAAFLNWR